MPTRPPKKIVTLPSGGVVPRAALDAMWRLERRGLVFTQATEKRTRLDVQPTTDPIRDSDRVVIRRYTYDMLALASDMRVL